MVCIVSLSIYFQNMVNQWFYLIQVRSDLTWTLLSELDGVIKDVEEDVIIYIVIIVVVVVISIIILILWVQPFYY